MGKRTWVKLHCDQWINGSLKDEPIEIRGVWACLLALVGNNQFSDKGELKLNEGVGWVDAQIIKALKISIPLWLKAKQHFIDTGMITVSEDNEIKILNWVKYQEDYSRQQKYRDNQKAQKPQNDGW